MVQKSILAAVTPLPLAALSEPGASDLLRSLTVLREEIRYTINRSTRCDLD